MTIVKFTAISNNKMLKSRKTVSNMASNQKSQGPISGIDVFNNGKSFSQVTGHK